MHLIEALTLGENCLLETLEECIMNVRIHAISIFSYESINDEEKELMNEVKLYLKSGGKSSDSISDVKEHLKGGAN